MVNKFEERQQWAEKISKAIDSGEIETASRATLTEYSTWLCTPLAQGQFGPDGRYEEVCEIVRLHILRTMIDAFENRSRIQGIATLVFAIMAIAATLMPYFIAPNPSSASSQAPTTSASPPNTSQVQNKSQLSLPIPIPNGQAAKQGTGKAAKANP